MTRIEIQKAFDELRIEQQRLAAVREKERTRKEEAEREIVELDKRLPELLVSIALARVAKTKGTAELGRIEKERTRLEEIIKYWPFLDKGLETEINKIPNRGNKITAIEHKWNAYDTQKAKIQGDYHSRYREQWETELLKMAQVPDLDCLEETQAFLKELKEGQEKARD